MKTILARCGRAFRPMFLAVGAALALIGGFLTASVVGAILGIPLLLVAWPLLQRPSTPRAC